MKTKLKICTGCNEEKVIWKSHKKAKYCQYCWHKYKFENEPKAQQSKKVTPIKKISDKKKAKDVLYMVLRNKFLENKPMCEAKLEDCNLKACDVHHIAGKIENLYLDDSQWLAVCRQCHQKIHINPKESRKLGLLK